MRILTIWKIYDPLCSMFGIMSYLNFLENGEYCFTNQPWFNYFPKVESIELNRLKDNAWYNDFITGKIKPIYTKCYLELGGRVSL